MSSIYYYIYIYIILQLEIPANVSVINVNCQVAGKFFYVEHLKPYYYFSLRNLHFWIRSSII
jgi:hypothetical protein